MSVLDRFKLTGKRLFITGGCRGLGREMALAIADAGADVILVGRDRSSLEVTAGDLRRGPQQLVNQVIRLFRGLYQDAVTTHRGGDLRRSARHAGTGETHNGSQDG